jgi:hypothetical protein
MPLRRKRVDRPQVPAPSSHHRLRLRPPASNNCVAVPQDGHGPVAFQADSVRKTSQARANLIRRTNRVGRR